ncbi:hypothetical protein BDF22DRAFT_187675 [Syncephalis plumigaleata]|nr:hypothetical protein BDF22DRAFT_187675 [Syncephalis plumigaleata]
MQKAKEYIDLLKKRLEAVEMENVNLRNALMAVTQQQQQQQQSQQHIQAHQMPPHPMHPHAPRPMMPQQPPPHPSQMSQPQPPQPHPHQHQQHPYAAAMAAAAAAAAANNGMPNCAHTPMPPSPYGYPPMPGHSPHLHGHPPHIHQHPTPPYGHMPAEHNEAAMYQHMPPHTNANYNMSQPGAPLPTPGPSMQTIQFNNNNNSNNRKSSISAASDVPPSSTGKRSRRSISSSNASLTDASSASPIASTKETAPPTPSPVSQPTSPPAVSAAGTPPTANTAPAAVANEMPVHSKSTATPPVSLELTSSNSSHAEKSTDTSTSNDACTTIQPVKQEADNEAQNEFLAQQPFLDSEHKKEPLKPMMEPRVEQDIVLLASSDADSSFEPISMFRKRKSIVDVEYEDMKRSYFNRRNSTLMAMEANNEQYASNSNMHKNDNTGYPPLGMSMGKRNSLPSSMLLPILPPPLGFEPLQQLAEEDVCCQVCKDGQSGLVMLDCDRCHSWFHGRCVGINERAIPASWICQGCSAGVYNNGRDNKVTSNV